jgi:pimeloyl-ACP methyl ester carboxylesterase
MPVIKAGAYDLDYWEAGRGPALLLVHSSASGNRQWRRLADDFDRHRLIAVNLFGYGATSPWPGDRTQTLADHADLVTAAAAAVAAPVVLIGHSLGAAVALEAALQLGEQVRMVIVFEPILFYLLKAHGSADAFAEIDAVGKRYREHAAHNDWEGAGSQFIDYWSGPGTWAALSPERRSGLIAVLPNVVHEWSAVLAPWRPLSAWRKIAAPIHLIRAADTRLPTRELAGLLTAAHAWHFHEVAEGGHMAPVSRPDLVNPRIVALLADAAPASASGGG